jgi:hypothetical protein
MFFHFVKFLVYKLIEILKNSFHFESPAPGLKASGAGIESIGYLPSTSPPDSLWYSAGVIHF